MAMVQRPCRKYCNFLAADKAAKKPCSAKINRTDIAAEVTHGRALPMPGILHADWVPGCSGKKP